MTKSPEEKPGFKTGDVVALKSGGPQMTCDLDLRDDGLVVCFWFNGGDLLSEAFDPRMLAPVEAVRGTITINRGFSPLDRPHHVTV